MKVLITGISGRVGANLAFQLLKKGYAGRGLIFPGDPNTEKVRGLGVEIAEADMNHADGVYRACDGCETPVETALFCDDRVHYLCARCLEPCPACGRRHCRACHKACPARHERA